MYGNSNGIDSKYKQVYIVVSQEEMAKHPEEQRAREFATAIIKESQNAQSAAWNRGRLSFSDRIKLSSMETVKPQQSSLETLADSV